ncbi:hypothetical protein HAX54_011986, partial [Datura stramonium]|nr:hypothetical protein [Datura stramonium]
MGCDTGDLGRSGRGLLEMVVLHPIMAENNGGSGEGKIRRREVVRAGGCCEGVRQLKVWCGVGLGEE